MSILRICPHKTEHIILQQRMKTFLTFELAAYLKKWWFYAALAAVFMAGTVVSPLRIMPSPNVSQYSPYSTTLMLGFMSLVGIFFTTLIAAQTLLREQESRFSQILYTTPITKRHYLASRFLVVFGISTLCMLMMTAGFTFGRMTTGRNIFHWWWYLQPFLLFTVPNLLFCAAAVSCAAWITQSRLAIYVSGLCIYIGYMVMLIFSTSPLMSKGMPVSPEMIRISALFDPFGLSAFFHQTSAWSVAERNTELAIMSGMILWNRILFLLISCGFLVLSFLFFRFSDKPSRINRFRRKKNQIPDEKEHRGTIRNAPLLKHIESSPYNIAYHLRTITSAAKLDFISIIRSTAFVVLAIGIAFYVGMEIYGDIEKGIRMPERFASTALMVNTILENFPSLCLPLLLFFSNELVWQSRNTRFFTIEDSTPRSKTTSMLAHWLALGITVFALTTWMILLGVAFQLGYGYFRIEWSSYLSLYALAGFPLLLSAGLAVAIQSGIAEWNTERGVRAKYASLVVAAIFIGISATPLARMAGFSHPLIRFTAAYSGKLSEMSAWSDYVRVFAWKMLFGLGVVLYVMLLASVLQKVPALTTFLQRKTTLATSLLPATSRTEKLLRYAMITGIIALTVYSGYYLTQNLVLPDSSSELASAVQYEKHYRSFQNLPQPIVTDVVTQIDLVPESRYYRVSGTYILHNKSTDAISRILIGFDSQTKDISGTLTIASVEYRITAYDTVITLQKPLLSSDSATFSFAFLYSWNGFSRHNPMNAIVENGAFMRISRYFPQFGYQADREITDTAEREAMQLGEASTITSVDAPRGKNHFVNLTMTISTAPDQIPIGIGEKIKEWSDSGRNFALYSSAAPVPFRFGVSSARYDVQKVRHKGVSVEVYYHPAHHENVPHLIENARNTLDYCQAAFGTYPFKSIRFAEVSGFTRGFNATAYPGTIFMNETMSFHANLQGDKKQDVINELAGHELSHVWWGNNQIAPDEREGASMLTETLAMYTELMLLKKMYGEQRALEHVRMHHDLYLSERGYGAEQPLYKTLPQNPHQHYSKGLVVMHQLSIVLGEEKLNQALKRFLEKHSYSASNQHFAPRSTDLLQEFATALPPESKELLNDMFKHITTYNLSIHNASVQKIMNKSQEQYDVHCTISVEKFHEDGTGKRIEKPFVGNVEIELRLEDGSINRGTISVNNSRAEGSVRVRSKPLEIEIDPRLRYIHTSSEKILKTL